MTNFSDLLMIPLISSQKCIPVSAPRLNKHRSKQEPVYVKSLERHNPKNYATTTKLNPSK